MGCKAAAQILKTAETLKAKLVANHPDLLNDLQAWTDQQQLQMIYHQVLVLDLEYALDKKVEQDLWTLVFKNHISILQEQTRDKKNPRRNDCQSLLSWCLEAASGCYLSLLQELCSTYDLEPPFRKCGAVFGKLRSFTEPPSNPPQSSSCSYICQYCLVHLGDIARYRNQRQQAENFYRHAILVSPYSGHPYNQLALLEASQGDKLATVYQYVRSIAVKNPFPAASANLMKTLSSTIDKECCLQQVKTKMSISEFIAMFLKAHALLYTQTDLKQAQLCVQSINATITALVATQSFSQQQLIMITVINMYAMHHLGEGPLTRDERFTGKLALALIAGALSAFLLPVYTLKCDVSILDYFALPAIRLLLMWIQSKPQLLSDEEFTSRLQIWPGYCKLLNILNEHTDKERNRDGSNCLPLFYDLELQGFLPVQEAFKVFDFKELHEDKMLEKHLQAFTLMEIAKWLTTYEVNGFKLIISKDVGNGLVFEPGVIESDPTSKLLEEMKSLNIADNGDGIKIVEKKAGILKPQGSLEKSRGERVKLSEESINATPKPNETIKTKRVSQNVALQSIYKKIEENKQVKFSPDAADKSASQQKQKTLDLPPPPSNNLALLRTPTYYQSRAATMQNGSEYFSYIPPPHIPMPPHNPSHAPPMGMQYQHQPSEPATLVKQPLLNFPPPVDQPTMERTPNWWPPGLHQTQQNGVGPNAMRPPCLLPPQCPPRSQDYFMFNPAMGQMLRHPNQDYFNNSPWQNARPLSANEQNMRGMSMRQTMLNESNKNLVENVPKNSNQGQAPQSYSLFNTSTWALPLPQLRTDQADNRQTTHANAVPQSLQQLLEQQNQLQKDNT